MIEVEARTPSHLSFYRLSQATEPATKRQLAQKKKKKKERTVKPAKNTPAA